MTISHTIMHIANYIINLRRQALIVTDQIADRKQQISTMPANNQRTNDMCFISVLHSMIITLMSLTQHLLKPSSLPPVFSLLIKALIQAEDHVKALFDISYT